MKCTFCKAEIECGDLVTLVAIDVLQFKNGHAEAFDEDDLSEFGRNHHFDRCLCSPCACFPERIAFAAKQYLIPEKVGKK